MSERQMFDCKHDNEQIEAGTHFWCHTCLVARPIDSRSPDPHYCQGCYDFLLIEAELLKASGNKHRPSWIPVEGSKKGNKQSATIPLHDAPIVSTVKDKKFKVDTMTAGARARPLPKRGPKFTELPENLIRQWAGEGMGSKAIATRLKGEGINVSYKTVERRLRKR